MRLAAIADIHGNHLALEAVLADIRAQGIDDIVNLGDMAGESGAGESGTDHVFAP
jgi:3',5'-cyclic AMP phosphodiesterase CpdA